MKLLDTEFRLVDEPLRELAVLLLSEALGRERRKRGARVAGTGKHEPRLAAQNDHEGAYVNLAPVLEQRILHVALDQHLFEAGESLRPSCRHSSDDAPFLARGPFHSATSAGLGRGWSLLFLCLFFIIFLLLLLSLSCHLLQSRHLLAELVPSQFDDEQVTELCLVCD